MKHKCTNFISVIIVALFALQPFCYARGKFIGEEPGNLRPRAVIERVEKAAGQANRIYLADDFVPWQGMPGREGPILYFNRLNYELYGASRFVTTVSNDPSTAIADAVEFSEHVSAMGDFAPKVKVVQEWGIGNAYYASAFLDRLQGTPLYSGGFRYVLCDFSDYVLANARQDDGLRKHAAHTEFARFNAGQLPFSDDSVLLIRHNELYDDLPAQELVYMDGTLHEVCVRPYIEAGMDIRCSDGTSMSRAQVAQMIQNQDIKGLARMREGFLDIVKFEWIARPVDDVSGVPYGDYVQSTILQELKRRNVKFMRFVVPAGALHNLEDAIKILHDGGYMRFNDYAIRDFDELLRLNEKKRSDIRGSHGTFTSAVNLMLVRAVAEARGCAVEIERQTDYLERVLKRKFIHVNRLVDAIDSIVSQYNIVTNPDKLIALLQRTEAEMPGEIPLVLVQKWQNEFKQRRFVTKEEFLKSDFYKLLREDKESGQAGLSREEILSVFLNAPSYADYYTVKIYKPIRSSAPAAARMQEPPGVKKDGIIMSAI